MQHSSACILHSVPATVCVSNAWTFKCFQCCREHCARARCTFAEVLGAVGHVATHQESALSGQN